MTNIQRLTNYLKDSCLTNETLTFGEIQRICGLDASSELMDYRRELKREGFSMSSELMDYRRELKREGFSIMKVSLGTRTVLFSRNA